MELEMRAKVKPSNGSMFSIHGAREVEDEPLLKVQIRVRRTKPNHNEDQGHERNHRRKEHEKGKMKSVKDHHRASKKAEDKDVKDDEIHCTTSPLARLARKTELRRNGIHEDFRDKDFKTKVRNKE